MKPIILKPQERIRQLEIENSRLRALVGERQAPAEPVEMTESEQAPTLIEQTDTLAEAVTLIAEVVL